MERNRVTLLGTIALACLAVAFAVIAVLSDGGLRWTWIVLAAAMVAVAGATFAVGAARRSP